MSLKSLEVEYSFEEGRWLTHQRVGHRRFSKKLPFQNVRNSSLIYIILSGGLKSPKLGHCLRGIWHLQPPFGVFSRFFPLKFQASHGWFFWNWRDGAGIAWDCPGDGSDVAGRCVLDECFCDFCVGEISNSHS